jgi:hypothetical protein
LVGDLAQKKVVRDGCPIRAETPSSGAGIRNSHFVGYITTTPAIEARLNELGAAGWELAAVVSGGIAYFKRLKRLVEQPEGINCHWRRAHGTCVQPPEPVGGRKTRTRKRVRVQSPLRAIRRESS